MDIEGYVSRESRSKRQRLTVRLVATLLLGPVAAVSTYWIGAVVGAVSTDSLATLAVPGFLVTLVAVVVMGVLVINGLDPRRWLGGLGVLAFAAGAGALGQASGQWVQSTLLVGSLLLVPTAVVLAVLRASAVEWWAAESS